MSTRLVQGSPRWLYLRLVLSVLFLCVGAHAQGDLITVRPKAADRKPATTPKRPPPAAVRPTNTRPTAPPARANVDIEPALSLGDAALRAVPPRFGDAETAYGLAIQLNDRDARGYVGLGQVYAAQKKYAEAESNYRRALSLADDNLRAYVALGALLLAQQHYTDAAPILRKALALDPQDTLALVNYGETLRRLGQLDAAAEQYQRAISLDSKLAAARSGLALIHFIKGETDKARKQWNEVVKLSAATALDRAGTLLLDNRYKDAATQLEQYTKDNPADEDGWLLLGDVRRATGDAAGARTAYARAEATAADYAHLPRPEFKPPAGLLSLTGLPGTAVRLEPTDGGSGRQGTVAADRSLNFNDLSPGRYRVTARLDGYEPTTKDLTIAPGSNQNATFELRALPSTKSLFAGPADWNEWSIPSGWGVGSHLLSVSGDGVAFPTQAGYRNYSEFLLSADVRLRNGFLAAFVLRATDERNYFLLELTGPAADEPYVLRGYNVVNGGRTPFGQVVRLNRRAVAGLGNNKFCTVQVQVVGNTAAVALADSDTGSFVPLGTLSLPTDGSQSGAVGIAGRAAAQTEVTRFAVYLKDDAAAVNWLRGRVTNAQGQALPDALVQFIEKSSGAVVARRTTATGDFSQDWLPPGAYTVRVSAPGYKVTEVDHVVSSGRSGNTLDPFALEADAPLKAVSVAASGASKPVADGATLLLPRFVTTTKPRAPENVPHGPLSTNFALIGTLGITAPSGTNLLIEPKVGKVGWTFTMPVGRDTAYYNQLPHGAYRVVAEHNSIIVFDQEVFVQDRAVVRVTIRVQQ